MSRLRAFPELCAALTAPIGDTTLSFEPIHGMIEIAEADGELTVGSYHWQLGLSKRGLRRDSAAIIASINAIARRAHPIATRLACEIQRRLTGMSDWDSDAYVPGRQLAALQSACANLWAVIERANADARRASTAA